VRRANSHRGLLVGAALSALLLVSTVAADAAPPAPTARVPVTTPVVETPYQPDGAEERGLWMNVEEAERALKTSPQIIRDSDLNAYVRSVLCRTVGEKSCSAVRSYIVRNPGFNATMAPNGMMTVNSGLLMRLTNEAQLASILGHEFSHYEHRHSLLLFRQTKKKGSTAVWLALTGIGLLAVGGIEASLYTYSRDMEREADLGGISKMVAAGYDPREASAPLILLRAEMDATAAERGRKSKKDATSPYDSHPASAERIAYLDEQAARAPIGDKGVERYRAAMADWWPRFLDDQVKQNDFGASDFLISSLGANGWSPALLYARGELYRARGAQGDLDKAVGFYDEAIGHGAKLPELWRGRGLALLKLDRGEEGRADLKTYLERAPTAQDRAMLAMLAGGTP
jgi:hypothetical protein